MNESKIGLTEGLLIASVPIAGYWIAFLYEIGYCKYFYIPLSFIEIGISNILIAIISIFGILLPAVLIFNVFFKISRNFPKRIIRIIRAISLSLLSMGVVFFINRFPLKIFILISIGILVPFFVIEFIIPLMARKEKSYKEKLDAQDKDDSQTDSIMDVLIRKIGTQGYYYSLVLIVFSLLTYFAGGFKALSQMDYIVMKRDTAEWVVIKKYDNLFLVANLDRSSKSFSTDFKLIPIDKDLNQFTFECIGPLKSVRLVNNSKMP